jgi:hypothetical protein
MPVIDPSLPGADIVAQAFEDLGQNLWSAAALGLQVVAPRLRMVGFDVPGIALEEVPELELYRRLSEERVLDPYSAYNAMLRRLNSFAAAVEAEYYRGMR